uniref:Uncharacterized protein n=1 Tax=Anguilla anguilla TaxID=7936 RepID=A0A0E9RJS0_ANGAN
MCIDSNCIFFQVSSWTILEITFQK